MKFFKKTLVSLITIIALCVVILLSAIIIDNRNISYLKINNNPGTEFNSYLINNVNVIPMTADTILTNKDVKIIDGKIAKIGVNLKDPSLDYIDGKAKFLMPGLTDMHVHVWDRYELGLYLSKGVTTVRNLWGQPMHLRMKKDIIENKILAPNFYTSGPKLTGPEYVGDDNLQIFTPEEGREMVVACKAKGYDFIKIYNGLTPEIFDAIINESRRQNIDIVAHPSEKLPYASHFTNPVKTIEHAEDIVQQPLKYKLDTVKLQEVVNLYASNSNSALCPTLAVYRNIYHLLGEKDIMSSNELDYMNPLIRMVDSKAQYDRWSAEKLKNPGISEAIEAQHNFHLLAIRKLAEVGVNIVCGTDAGIGITLPGFSIHQELELYKLAGLSNYDVLKTATVNPSKTHAFLKNTGSIEIGKEANLILLDDNPFVNLNSLQNIRMLFIKGKKIEKRTLDNFEDKAKNRNNKIVSGLRYAEFLLKKY
ncbi:amidohydrolase family protein [Salinimicrobium sp. TIG7-5_MAKvit]|uniref:amidohydrolase family protein n=1 Tax=Salinimicrobium sp. TIG7-5_MAKvit TaxID=3121289 RepID=UPI003C6DDBAB